MFYVHYVYSCLSFPMKLTVNEEWRLNFTEEKAACETYTTILINNMNV